MTSYKCHAVRVCLWIVLSAALCWSQTGTGKIQGTVKDASEAVVPGAQVILVHTATNRQYNTGTNDVGFYLFPSIELGDYELTASSPGMETWKGRLHLLAGQTAEVDVTLKTGSTSTTVEITGNAAPLVTTTAATLATVVEPERIQQLPIDGRHIDQLLFMTTPGAIVETHVVDNINWVPRVFGLRNASELVQDGAPLHDKAWGTYPNRPPGMDSIAEFRAEMINSSAKFDRPGTFMMTTKSGTNEVHGSAFETARNSGLGVARRRQDFYVKAPHLVRNEFGVSVGGPVFLPKLYNGKNKTFFFVGYEGNRLRQNTTGSTTVPTAAMRQGDFSGLVESNGRLNVLYDPWSVTRANSTTYLKTPYQNNQIPLARQSPLAKYLNSITPLPTLPSVNPTTGSANWYGPMVNNQDQWTITSKLDHRLSERDQLWFRYSHSASTLLLAGNALTNSPPTLDNKANLAGDFGVNDSGAANWTHTFSPTFFTETLITVTRDYRGREPSTGAEEISSKLGLPNPAKGVGFPRITGNFDFSYDSGTNPSQIYTWVYNFNQNFTKVKGRHELQFGVRFRPEKYWELEDQQVQQGQADFDGLATALQDPNAGDIISSVPYTGHTAANFFLGVSADYSARFNRLAYPYSNWETAAFFQDNYKVNSRLTLNLGLRYEYINPIQVADHSLVGFDPATKKVILGTSMENLQKSGAVQPIIAAAYQKLGVQYATAQEVGLPSTLIHKNPWNFDPRVGAAYRITTGQRPLVVRGGYSIFQFGQPLRFTSGYTYTSIPQRAFLEFNPTAGATSPDGEDNPLLRVAPTLVAGVNTSNVLKLEEATGITPGCCNVSYVDPHLKTPRAHQWNLIFEKEIMENTALSFGYVGTHAANMGTWYEYNSAPPSYLWYVTSRQPIPGGYYADSAMRPYDSKVYGNVREYQSIGWSNSQNFKFELEHRYSKGYAFQVFYVLGNSLAAAGQSWYGANLNALNQYLPDTVPTDPIARLRLTQYQRDPSVPKHSLTWNWIVDLPMGRGKPLGRNMNRVLDKIVGGWQVAGNGGVTSKYYKLPASNWGPVGDVQVYGTKYPILDCTSGPCYDGYLYWNGYISPKLRNVTNSAGKCTGICGIPADYQPANPPLIVWGQTSATLPNMPPNTNLSPLWDSNPAWVPLQNGNTVRTTYNTGMNPLQNQYIMGPFTWNLNASLFKVIPIREKMFMRLNADFFSVLNRPGIPQPGSNGIIRMNTSANPARVLQLTMRLQW